MAGKAGARRGDPALGRGGEARGATRRQRAAAIGLPILVHLAVGWALFATASGVLPHGAQAQLGDGDAVEVMLSGWEGAASANAQRGEAELAAQSQLDNMVERLRTASSDLYITEPEPSRPRGDLAALFDAPASGGGKGREGTGGGLAGRRDDGGDKARTSLASALGQEADGEGAAGALWGQVQRCWSRLPGRSTVPVTLEVVLTGDGRLAKPPRIIRPGNGRPEEVRLVAEARALEAITACLPYADAGGLGGRAQRVSFPGKG
jgi:hypothetical protein